MCADVSDFDGQHFSNFFRWRVLSCGDARDSLARDRLGLAPTAVMRETDAWAPSQFF